MPGPVWKLSPSSRPEPGAALPPKVGGEPDVLGRLPWPSCASCGEQMRFLFQLAHLEGRLELAPYSSVHVFRCENSATACETFSPDAGANRAVGVVAGVPELLGAPASQHPHPQIFMAVSPASEDTAALSIDKDTASFDALGAYDRAAERAPKSKLGGVPVWPQGDATPTCCGERMEFLAQLYAAEWGLEFGDDGTGYVFRCAQRCEDPFKFLWEAS